MRYLWVCTFQDTPKLMSHQFVTEDRVYKNEVHDHRPISFHQLAINTGIRPYHDLCLTLACPDIILLELYSGMKPAEHVPKFCPRYVMLSERILW